MAREKKSSTRKGPSLPGNADPKRAAFRKPEGPLSDDDPVPRQADLFPSSPSSSFSSSLPPDRCKPGPIRVGTSGYSFIDWVGPFYPPGTRRAGMLDFYRRCFNTVEVNATYYRIPPPSTMRGMATRTPADFQFMVKVPGPLTHRRDRDPEPAEGFLRAIGPLAAAKKYAGALAQFPYSFRRSTESESYLQWLRQTLPGMPLFTEFRHASWDGPDLEEFLRGVGLGFCSVDEPSLAGLFPRRALLVGDVAYVRFHGRNAGDWWSGGPRRYDYQYTRAELEQWTSLIREMAARAKRTYVFFNNCHAGHAVLNARMMEELLGLERES